MTAPSTINSGPLSMRDCVDEYVDQVLLAEADDDDGTGVCRYAGHPLHVCTNREGGPLRDGQVCWVEARRQVLDQQHPKATPAEEVGPTVLSALCRCGGRIYRNDNGYPEYRRPYRWVSRIDPTWRHTLTGALDCGPATEPAAAVAS